MRIQEMIAWEILVYIWLNSPNKVNNHVQLFLLSSALFVLVLAIVVFSPLEFKIFSVLNFSILIIRI